MKARRAIARALLPAVALGVGTVVDLGYSTYEGVALANGVSQWLGMRYAAPPLGGLRFAAPQDPASMRGLQSAARHGKHCLAAKASANSNRTSEDCLFLDVQAPGRASPGAKLPVFIFIQGGGFNENAHPNINASGLILASGLNIVVVSFNYRVGPFGFLNDGRHIQPNIGLRDQRKVFAWVQEHIAKFGGDPEHVVLGGASAGAASIALHMTSEDGASGRSLFHGVIGESPSFATILSAEAAAYQYRHFAVRLGCFGEESLAYLRNKTAREIQEHNENIPLPGGAHPPIYMCLPVLDGDLVPAYTYQRLEKGQFAKMPAIFGDDTNGGTIFTPRNTSSLAQSDQFLLDQTPFLSLEQLGQINRLYPNPNTSCPADGFYWRQVSNVYGEVRYTCPARAITSALTKAGVDKSFAYLWNVEDPAQMEAGLGMPHTVELGAIFGPDYAEVPESYKKDGKNHAASAVIQRYWTNFIRTYDPNMGESGVSKQTKWEPWSAAAPDRLVFATGGKVEMAAFGDDLNRRCDFWASNGVAMHL